MTTTWLITGSNRGIGLEIVKQLLASPENIVIATCRKPDAATALKGLETGAAGKLHVVPLDVSDSASIKASAESLKDLLEPQGLDYLINNAGVLEGPDTAFDFNEETFLRTFKANVVGPGLTAQAYLPYLERGSKKTIMNLSSSLGSIGSSNYGRQDSSYCITKTAVNMLTYKQAAARKDIIAFAIDPGWVSTDMGGPNADLKPEVSVAGLLKVITSITPEQSGKFLRYNGEEVPW
ncbi:NAD-P-binding protein [Gloeopeniophorella convolvens]|nr:NAD-P-binding protein [Gloeopeniophorella convolvens]